MELVMLNVKQPWADALVAGKKDIENRSFGPFTTTKFPFWAVIVASKAKPTYAMKATYQQLTTEEVRDDLSYGAIVGAVKFSGVTQQSDSVWYDQGTYGWVVEEAIKFPCPLEGVKGCQTPFRKLRSHPDKERIGAYLLDIVKKY